ncbi:MAG: DUF1501 domain-containing protein [Planctomycetes bacterium]|nr:DUF1501 domain-containing protein [Planctomycetota bacterium]
MKDPTQNSARRVFSRGSMTRRKFLRTSTAAAAAAALTTALPVRGATRFSGLVSPARAAGAPRILVMLRLYGGNDGLNTVVPYQTGAYYDNRPALAVPSNQVLAIDGNLGLHPRMTELKTHFDANRLAIVQSVGYSPANLSHFRSELIWQSADVNVAETGWVGRYLDTLAPVGDSEVRAVDVSYSLDPVFLSNHANVFAFPGVDDIYFPTDGYHYEEEQQKRDLFERLSLEPRAAGSAAETLASGGYVLSRNMDKYRGISVLDQPTIDRFPASDLGNSLRNVARMIRARGRSEIVSGVFQVGIDGFDTHSDQNSAGGHPDLWGDISKSLDAFHGALGDIGAADDVIVLVWSEFGRRVEENGSDGTDHGTAAPVFVFGNAVRGGLYGPNPNLADLDADDNLKHAIDFRQVYSTILTSWLSADAQQILGGTYAPVPFL